MPRRSIDNRLDFLSPVALIPGLGPKRVAALRQSGIETIGQLLYHFPRRYIDRSTVIPIGSSEQYLGATCTVLGTVKRTRVEKGRRPRLRIQVGDDSGDIEALWFRGVAYFRKAIRTGQQLLLTGKVSRYAGYQMVHPLIESVGASGVQAAIKYLPQYGLSESMREVGFQQKALFKVIKWALDNLNHYPQILPKAIEQDHGFAPLAECLRQIHIPDDPKELDRYRARVRYEELYQLALTLRWSRRMFARPGRSMKPGGLPQRLEKHLPFRLTDEQRKAIDILRRDAESSRRMHRLLEGDVGCGKTIAAFFACLPALNEGLQVAWMAPTEVLAQQSFERMSGWLDVVGFQAALLTGSTAAVDRRTILHDLASGVLRFVVGTHALLQPAVKVSKLGMIVIDEQQRFGAEQRLKLAEKDAASDFLLMSATPIPQTLAKTLYGDLDVVTIGSLPEGRQPVHTHVVSHSRRADMETYIAKEIRERGRKVFFLVPRIEGDAEEQVQDVHTVLNSLGRGPLAEVSRAMVHGRMSSDEKATVMQQFARGDISILVATSIVEVGIDVAKATIMVIENAERFGLSQLHQLRGRVARGALAGYCFLLPGQNLDEAAAERLHRFCKTTDGFEIADLDLSLRGPGDVVGFRQSGWEELKVADILRDAGLFREIQEELERRLPARA